MLKLLESLQTLHGENKHVLLAASTGDEVDKMIDRVDNETKEAQFSYRKVTARKAKEITRARVAHLRAHMARIHTVTWLMQTNKSSGFKSQSFQATRKNISHGGQGFPVVWMKQIVSSV